ncbi:AraC family ligand binding domain-containing protein [Paraburkholderia sp. MM5482-R1]|uniref:AraC family ligand binding domain-containing protein n=1 Tax=Paraburkholderia sp. MM5482-R1 TaxID=2991063 RepID=UPI003D1A210C
MSGSGHHIIDSIRYEVRPNTLFFMAPGQIHDFALSEDTVGHAISFSSEFFAFKVQNRHSQTEIPVYDFERIPNTVYMSDAQAQDLHHVLDGIDAEYQGEEAGYEDVIWSYLRILLIKSVRLGGDAVTDVNSSRSVLLSRRFKSLLEKTFHHGPRRRSLRMPAERHRTRAERCDAPGARQHGGQADS